MMKCFSPLYLILISFVSTAQCTDVIPVVKVDTVVLYDSIPSTFYEIKSIGNTKLLRTNQHWTEDVFIANYKDSSWRIWEIDDYFYDPSKFEISKMKVAGIKDSVIYVVWDQYDVGSGMGSMFHQKSLWSGDGQYCYLNFIDKCTYVFKDKYGDNATYKVYYTDYYCKATVSKFGIRITTNNTCGNKFGDAGGPEMSSYDMVAKYTVGFYYFKNDKWNLRNK